MKKILLLALPVLAAAALIPAALAGNGPANKVNGDLTFINASGPAHWVFNAQDLPTGDKGNVLYEDDDGVYTATVTNAVVKNGKATFTAKVTSSTNDYAQVRDKFTNTVYDNGEGSKGTGDSFTFKRAVLDGNPYNPDADHAVRHHVGQHPGPLHELIRPRRG